MTFFTLDFSCKVNLDEARIPLHFKLKIYKKIYLFSKLKKSNFNHKSHQHFDYFQQYHRIIDYLQNI